MLLPTKFIGRTLSLRISLTVVFATATLLITALLVMLLYSRKVVKETAMQKAEQTLEGTMRQIDNILLSVEQSAGNMYWEVATHLGNPERMFLYSQKLVEANPYIDGCAIAFEPYYYKEKGQYFMAYVYRNHSEGLDSTDSPVIQAETFGNVPYPEQIWYKKCMEIGRPYWINPLKNDEVDGEAITTFSLPIYNPKGRQVAVLAVDVLLSQLSEVVLAAKPSQNSYATLLGSDGSYIVHPDSVKLLHQTVFTQTGNGVDPTVKEAAEAMVSGETGYKRFRLNSIDSYVFYKPFVLSNVVGRSEQDLGWSVGIVYPEDDIFGDYHRLVYIVLAIAIIGLLLLLLTCQTVTHRQLLPLRMLAKSAQRISEGHYDDPIPDSRQQDEVGRLQDYFQRMQQALSVRVGELRNLSTTLRERGERLEETYKQVKEADRLKTTFLHNMTDQMTEPVNTISTSVRQLCDHCQEMDKEEAVSQVDKIQREVKVIADVLNHLLDVSLGSVQPQEQ